MSSEANKLRFGRNVRGPPCGRTRGREGQVSTKRGRPWSAEHGGAPTVTRVGPCTSPGMGTIRGGQEGARRMTRCPSPWLARKGEGKNFRCPQKEMATICCCLWALWVEKSQNQLQRQQGNLVFSALLATEPTLLVAEPLSLEAEGRGR